MARPRSLSDDVVLDKALDVMRRGGPQAATFAAVAGETGLAAATLVQRFGSKQGLIRAALLRAWDVLDDETGTRDAAAPVTPAGAVAILADLSAGNENGDFTDGLLFLREDFRDPELARRGAAWGETLAQALGRRLADASGPRPDLGRQMAAQWQGVVLWWGFARDQPAGEAVTAALDLWCSQLGYSVEPD